MTARRFFAIVLTTSLLVAIPAASAWACGNSVILKEPLFEKPKPEVLISKAEKLTDKGKYQQAMRNLFKAHPDLLKDGSKLNRTKRSRRTWKRARAAAAKIVAYTGGEVHVHRRANNIADDAKRQRQIRWAIRVLDANTVADRAMRAVLLAQTDEIGKMKARRILEKLADEDLIPYGVAFGTLAQLRAEAGDAEGARLAAQRCEIMATGPVVCAPSNGI